MLQKHFYKKVYLLLLFVLSLSLLCLSGCGENNTSEDDFPIVLQEDTTLMETFTLINLHEKTHKLTISPKKLTFYDVDQSAVVIHIFQSFDTETSYLLKSLDQLQKELKEKVFIVSLQVGDKIPTQTLQTFITKHHLTHFISNDIENNHFKAILEQSLSLSTKTTLPLTVIYSEGKYHIHYESGIPIEMLRYNIQQAIQE